MVIRSILKLYLIFGISLIYSQTYEDVLRYNSYNYEGTSRFNSMGGAFGALGGDLSAISINPAGSSIFLESEFGVTLNYKNNEIRNNFNNNQSISKEDLVSFNQVGLVLVYENRKSKFSFGYNMNRFNDFNDSFMFSGKNNNGIDKYFLYYADGLSSSDLSVFDGESIQSVYKFLGDSYGYGDQQAFLGYQSYLINEVDELPNNYISNTLYTSLNQLLSIDRKGDHLVHSLNFSTFYNDYLYLGLNFNFHSITFEEYKFFKESNYSNNSPIKRVQFEENLFALGEGFSIQFGSLLKFNNLRIGLSYTSPSFLKFDEETSQYIESDILEDDNLKTISVDPNTINLFEEYRLTLPSKSMFSLAYIFGSKGLISFDYELTKYNNSKFDDNNGRDSYLKSMNTKIKNNFKGLSKSIRIGGEYRIKNYTLRSGYLLYEGPDSFIDNEISGLSVGLGINYGYFNIDLSLAKSNNFYDNRLYNRGLTSSYSIDKDIITFSTTFTMKL